MEGFKEQMNANRENEKKKKIEEKKVSCYANKLIYVVTLIIFFSFDDNNYNL